jgi:branched-chain amino acid transport system ATP-binding protein
VRHYQGRILYRGTDISGLPTARRVRSGIGVVPEGRELFSRLTVLENLQLGARGSRRSDRLREAFELFPVLDERRNQVAGTLSGGEQQMLAIARALMADPAVLILDEPSAGLAPSIVRDLVNRLARVTEQGKTLILIEQNVRIALKLADHAAVLNSGVLVATGTPEELGHSERIASL